MPRRRGRAVRILITGGNGFLGRRVAALALARGQQVRLPGRTSVRSASCWRRTQPIVHYRRNDVLRLDPAPCPWLPLPGDRRRGGVARRSLLLTEPRRYPAPLLPRHDPPRDPLRRCPDRRLPRDPGATGATARHPRIAARYAVRPSHRRRLRQHHLDRHRLRLPAARPDDHGGASCPKKREPGDGACDGSAERGTGRRPACHLARRRGR